VSAGGLWTWHINGNIYNGSNQKGHRPWDLGTALSYLMGTVNQRHEEDELRENAVEQTRWQRSEASRRIKEANNKMIN
jgi:hypothetical protein